MNDGLEQMKRLLHNGISEYKLLIASREIAIKSLEEALSNTPMSNLHRILAAMKGELALLSAARDRREKGIVIVVEMEIAVQAASKQRNQTKRNPQTAMMGTKPFKVSVES